MFDPDEAFRIVGEPFEGLTRAEIEERRALNREFRAWIDEREAHFRSVIAAREAER
jgi:hypothetical protein